MNTIIALTDFSEAATNAVNYACRLAKACNTSVTVMHAYIVPVAFSDMPMPLLAPDDARQIADEKMNAFLHTLPDLYPGLTIYSKIMYGDIIDCVEEYMEDGVRPMLVILGNSGTGNSSMLGSTGLSALRNIAASVMAVPATTHYRQVKNICLASDLRQVSDAFPADALKELVNATGAALHVVNVDSENEHFKPDTPFESSMLHQMLANVSPQYHYETNTHPDEGIHDFLEKNEMDWLVVTPHKHSFLEGLFHKSHTKALMRMTDIPIVALHQEE